MNLTFDSLIYGGLQCSLQRLRPQSAVKFGNHPFDPYH